MTAITVDVVVAKYIELRTEAARIESEAKERCNAIKENMGKLEVWLAAKAEEQGVESFKTPHGTAFWQTVDYAQVADWSATLPFIVEHSAWDMLEKRVSKTAVRAYIADTKEVPPGVNYGTKREINVRRPTKKE